MASPPQPKTTSTAAWFPLTHSGSDPWLVSFYATKSNAYVTRLTNLRTLYEETLPERDIQSRCSHLNPAVEADTGDLLDELSAILFAKTSHVQLEKLDGAPEKKMGVHVRGKLFGYDFRWTFQLARLSEQALYEVFTSDLMRCMGHLFAEQRHLLEVIQAKDRELADYEQSGATLTRRTLKTSPFSEADLDKVTPPDARNDGSSDELMHMLSTEQYRCLRHRMSVAKGLPSPSASKSPDEARERRKRIRIKGIKKDDLFCSDDEDEDDNNVKANATISKKSPVKNSEATSATKKPGKMVAKKLRKL